MKTVLLVQGARGVDEIPGLETIVDEAEIRFANSADDMRSLLPGAEAMLAWDFRAVNLADVWDRADSLRWIHRCGAGVDAALFPALVDSDVIMTNARGVFDRAMAEWTLGVIIAFAKQFRETLEFQARAEWNYRMSETIADKRVLVVGVGSIGRSIAQMLRAAGMSIEGVGRSARPGDDVFDAIHTIEDLHTQLPGADYVVLITPLTEQTRNLFGAAEFAAMAPHARFINIGRGPLVVEEALVAALHEGQIAGAALDVFVEEPLPPDSPFWSAPNCFVSPHMSGDYIEYQQAMTRQFLHNWRCFRDGSPMINLVDKALGFAAPAENN